MAKQKKWYDVEEDETIEMCLERIKRDGYMPIKRKEEPLFQMINGEPTILRQKIQFQVVEIED